MNGTTIWTSEQRWQLWSLCALRRPTKGFPQEQMPMHKVIRQRVVQDAVQKPFFGSNSSDLLAYALCEHLLGHHD